MANLIIKPTSGGSLILQDEGGDAALTVGTTGSTTLAGTANNIGTATAGTLSSGVTFPAGHILQVVQGSATAGLITTSTTNVTTGLSAAITPSATSSKILVTISITYDGDANGTAGHYSLYAAGSVIRDKISYFHAASSRVIGNIGVSYLHSPSTTSATTYELYVKKMSGTRIYSRYGDTWSSIVLMEVKG